MTSGIERLVFCVRKKGVSKTICNIERPINILFITISDHLSYTILRYIIFLIQILSYGFIRCYVLIIRQITYNIITIGMLP